jgi:hypothetical protein
MKYVHVYDLEEGGALMCNIDDELYGVELFAEGSDGLKCSLMVDKQLFKRFCMVGSKMCNTKPKQSTSAGFVIAHDPKDSDPERIAALEAKLKEQKYA